MPELRVKFSRTGAAKYLSHLDVFHCFSRAFTRVGIPLAFSQGFNPHPYISIVHPLSVGVEGYEEILDFAVTDRYREVDTSVINAALPSGLQVIDLYTPVYPVKVIAFAEYRMEFEFDNGISDAKDIERFFNSDNIPVVKKTKSGISTVNLRNNYDKFVVADSTPNTVTAYVRMHASNAPVNPKYFTVALSNTAFKPNYARYTRLRFTDINGDVFR